MYTKGEWKYKVNYKKDKALIQVEIPNGCILTLGQLYEDDCNVSTCCKVEEHSNAKLIAAAPDLLEACKEFVRKVECGEARSTKSYSQMKLAIKKAGV